MILSRDPAQKCYFCRSFLKIFVSGKLPIIPRPEFKGTFWKTSRKQAPPFGVANRRELDTIIYLDLYLNFKPHSIDVIYIYIQLHTYIYIYTNNYK